MTRFLLGITILGAAAVLTGCPIYPDSGSYRVCTNGRCYDCPDTTYSEACVQWTCGRDADCGDGYVCSANACVPGGFGHIDAAPPGVQDASTGPSFCTAPAQCPNGEVCGSDATCHVGDCALWRCVAPYACVIEFGHASCVLAGRSDSGVSSPDAAGDGSAQDAPVDAGPDVATMGSGDRDAGNDSGPSDGATGDVAVADATPPPVIVPCNADGQCGGGGNRCLNGVCTAPGALCSDATQCADGQACVDGECTPRCSSAVPCPIGFDCDLNRAVCSENPAFCGTTADCQGGKVCVENHCVAPCAAADAASAICPGAEICVNGGCIPNQAAAFACKNDGYTGPVANACDPGRVCLHGDCYVGCALDSGACAEGDVCKNVTTAQGTFAVCAPPAELGSDCDPAAGTFCPAGALCIDGYCK